MSRYDVIVIGAGGAGMFCAAESAARGRSVLLLDHGNAVGKKILISGGGRCNFTNLGAKPECYVSGNPHFVKSALSRYTQHDFIELVERHRIRYHEKKLGQLFCDESAAQIVEMLVGRMKKSGVELLLDCKIESVEKPGVFEIATSRGKFSCESLVIATGGLSVPQTGASGFGYDLAKKFGIAVTPLAPALDGFDWRSSDLSDFTALAGVSLDVSIKSGKATFRENILFTHKGLSGPASLQASLYWQPGQSLAIDLLPEKNAADLLGELKGKRGRQEVKNILGDYLPKRFAEYFTRHMRVRGTLAELDGKTLERLSKSLNEWSVSPERTVGYKKAEVTRGGVDTRALSSSTMETKAVPGLFFIGEVVDVTGWLGGYNFQWAWSSAYAAAQQA